MLNMRGVFSGMSLMLQHKEAQWQCCQKGEWVTVTPHPSTQRFWHLFNMLRTKFNSKDQQLQNMYVHTHTHTSTHTETNCGTHSLLPLCWRRTRVFWVGVFRHKLPYCQRKNKINRYKAETGWSAAAVYCSDSYASSTVITVSCCSVLQ